MAIAPQKGNNRTKVGFFAKTAFGCCCFFTFISVILLFAFKNKAKRAMSGQLVSLDSASPVSIADDHQMINVVLDYFGSSSILFPLLVVYICYKIFISQTLFKKFDGFVHYVSAFLFFLYQKVTLNIIMDFFFKIKSKMKTFFVFMLRLTKSGENGIIYAEKRRSEDFLW